MNAEARCERTRLLAHPLWFAALYPGVCVRCGKPFKAGTPIMLDPQGWRAQCCSAGAS